MGTAARTQKNCNYTHLMIFSYLQSNSYLASTLNTMELDPSLGNAILCKNASTHTEGTGAELLNKRAFVYPCLTIFFSSDHAFWEMVQ